LKELTLLQRLFVACYGFDWYLIRFAVPRGLSAFHPYPDLAKAWPIELVAAPVLVLATVGVVLWSRRYTRAAAFGTLFFGLALVLVLQALPIGIAIVAERYTYVSYVGVGFVLAMGYEFWIRRWRSRQWLVLGTRATAAVVILGLSYLCFERVQVWRNSGTLWTDAIEKYPTLGSAYISRGAFYMKELKDYDAAMRDFDRAVALAPHDYTSYFNRGVLFQRLGDKARAVEDYSRAIATNPTKPGPYVNRGGMYCELKQFDAAVEDYSRALALDPAAQSYFNRGAALYQAGAYDRALTDYDAGLRLKPDDADKLFFKGVIEFRLKRYDGAIVSLSRALAIQPKDGRSYLYRARCYAVLGRMEAARKDAFTARELGESVQDGLVDEKE
jgi:tetratricopeptide (TPR) repeat protein